jgi:hypothetical protein
LADSVTDKETLTFIDQMDDEGAAWRDSTGISDVEINRKFARGEQFSQMGHEDPIINSQNTHQQSYRFVMNLLDSLLKRKAALITDSKPMIDIMPPSKDRQNTADIYKNTIYAIWDENDAEMQFAREMVRAQIDGATVCMPVWDHTADYGRGNIRLRFYEARMFTMDPSITAASKCGDAEFQIFHDIMPVNAIREMFPNRGMLVMPESRYSSYRKERPENRTTIGRIQSAMSTSWRDFRGGGAQESAVPKVMLRHTYFRDWERDERDQPKFGVPRRIRHVVDAGGIKLVDETMPYIHRQMPGHLFDWGMEVEHPWGMSEVKGLRRIQYTLNRLVGEIIENVFLTNRVHILADTDAIDRETWARIARGRNGLFIKKKVGRSVQVTAPPPMPAHLLQLVHLLVSAVDMVSGMNEASRGVRPEGIVSGVAISTLAQQAQAIIRLESRSFESWLKRIFQQVVPLIYQFFSSARLMHLRGADGKLLEFELSRRLLQQRDDRKSWSDFENDWQDFQFRVQAGSSLASTRMQRGVVALNLFQAGLLPGSEVLRAAEWPEPERTAEEALQQRIKLGPLAQSGRGGKPIRVPGTRAGGV